MADLPAAVSSNYNFGSLASIRKQAAAIAKRVDKQAAALHEEIERTGMIQNGRGEMVPVSSLTDIERRNLEGRAVSRLVSTEEAVIGLLATAPNSDEVEADHARAAICRPIQDKMLAGKKLTGQEKKFLREYYPQLAATADRMEAEAKALEQRLKRCKSPEEAQRMVTEAKAQVLSGVNEKDSFGLFVVAALDEAYKKHQKRGACGITMDLWA